MHYNIHYAIIILLCAFYYICNMIINSFYTFYYRIYTINNRLNTNIK